MEKDKDNEKIYIYTGITNFVSISIRYRVSSRVETVTRIAQKKNPVCIRIHPDFLPGSKYPDRNRTRVGFHI